MGSIAALALAASLAPPSPTETTLPIEPPIVAPSPESASPPPDRDDEIASTRVLLWAEAPPDAADDRWTARVQRVQAELAAVGIEAIVFVPVQGRDVLADLQAEMRARHARLALWIAHDRDRAELWRDDDGRLVDLAIITGDETSDDEHATFAVRCVEVVQALSIDIEVPPVDRTPTTPATTSTPPAKREEAAPRWSARAIASLGGAARDIGLLVAPGLGAGVMLGRRRRIGIDGELVATALTGSVRGPAGRARVGLFAARVHVGIWPWPRARVSMFVGIGGGTLVGWTHGNAATPYRSRTDATAVALVSSALDLAVRVSRRVRLRFGARVGVALPAIRVDDGSGSRRTAQPLGEAIVGVEIVGKGGRR